MSEVFDYVSDFDRAAEWRTEVVDSSMSPPAPMVLGSRLREVSRIAGREVVTESVVDEISAPTRWSFAHVSGPLPVRRRLPFESGPDGVGVTYRLDGSADRCLGPGGAVPALVRPAADAALAGHAGRAPGHAPTELLGVSTLGPCR